MDFFSKAYCRTYQTIFRWAMPLLPYREPKHIEQMEDIKNIILDKGYNKVMLITDEGVRTQKLTTPLERDLKAEKLKLTVYDKVLPNPTIALVEEVVELYTTNGCECIIAFGGGSVMDTAKAVGARVSNPQKPLLKMRGLMKIKNPPPTIIAIPTTAGTGSETTVTAVITDNQTHKKYTINDFKLIPEYVLLDASLTYKLPPNITATTGMDALTHAIEAFIGNSTTDDTRKNALEAARLIFENIEKVCLDGSNERARSHMLRASYMAGLAFTKSYVGYVHAIAHSLGGKYNTPHGLANAVILPYVLSEYGNTVIKKLKVMAVYCNVARPYDSEQNATNKFINRILDINETLGIPKTFDFIKEEDIEEMAKNASREANPLYPVPKLMNAKELQKIYYKIKA